MDFSGILSLFPELMKKVNINWLICATTVALGVAWWHYKTVILLCLFIGFATYTLFFICLWIYFKYSNHKLNEENELQEREKENVRVLKEKSETQLFYDTLTAQQKDAFINILKYGQLDKYYNNRWIVSNDTYYNNKIYLIESLLYNSGDIPVPFNIQTGPNLMHFIILSPVFCEVLRNN